MEYRFYQVTINMINSIANLIIVQTEILLLQNYDGVPENILKRYLFNG